MEHYIFNEDEQEKAKEAINHFKDRMMVDKYPRYESWEICYKLFCKTRKDLGDNRKLKDEILNELCLNLGFYLASWGMMRGSSFLLQNNYMIHENAVKLLMQKEYDKLEGVTADYIIKNHYEEKISKLSDAIKKCYEPNNVTDTLVTKILLGTLGCIPAYDQFLKESIKEYDITQTFNKKSILQLATLYKDNSVLFEDCRKTVNDARSNKNVEYPQMKILDMCMWQLTYGKQKNNK